MLARVTLADLHVFDESVLASAHSTSESFIPLFSALTVTGSGFAMLVLLPFLAWPKTRMVTAWLFAAIVAQAAIVSILKVVVGRLRPCAALAWSTAVGVCPTSGSMPSGHAAGAFTFALFVSVRDPRWAPLAIGWACLVGWSRCVLGMHYPTDVIAGALVGGAVGAGVAAWSRRRARKVVLTPAT
jgi:undecaprenyl-diphosphatase